MPIRLILIAYAITWTCALMANGVVELARLRSERGVATWIDYAGFALTAWLVLPLLPLIAMVVSLQRRDWLSALLKTGPRRPALTRSPAAAAHTRG